MKKALLSVSMLFFALSLVGILFVSNSFMAFGFIAFILMFGVGVFQHGSKGFEPSSGKVIPVMMAFFIPLFLVVALLSGSRGAPDLGKKAVFARRGEYNFTRSEKEPRWRFVTVAACFHLLWHGFGIAFARELQKNLSQKSELKSRNNN